MNMVMNMLLPLPVAGPLAVAGLLLAAAHWLPRRVPDVITLLTTLAAAAACGVIAMRAADGPLVTWFGGWVPRHGQAIGISFVADQAGAGVASFIGVLFAASTVFAWGYFDEVHAHFHVLMLLFMAGMIGFCLTHDLFNLFVWFEVMSVAAFALTGYRLRSSALVGALNFTVTNTIGSYFILGGIGLAYAKLGALDFAALGEGVAANPGDTVVIAAFVLLASGLLIKGAQVPFHFWLADAHAVAPSPVSVIFSGAMVAIGLFGVARLTWGVFAPSPAIMHVAATLLLGMGAASAVVGGVMALTQRHIKRLLAFSTISHAGIMLIGLALLSPAGLSGMLAYLVGHGLTKGALFMVAGMLLAICGGIDEIGLRGMGRGIWPAGIAMGTGGLLLAGLPWGMMDGGIALIAQAARASGQHWVLAALMTGTACTGGAVLRVVGRVFLGWGAVPGEEEFSPTEEEQENADRPLWLMMIPASLLLALAVVPPGFASGFLARATAQFIEPQRRAVLGLQPFHAAILPASTIPKGGGLAWLSVGLAIAVAAYGLARHRMPTARLAGAPGPLSILGGLHSGLVGDYVAWITVGVALFAGAFAFG